MRDEELMVARLFLEDLEQNKGACNEIETLKKALNCYKKAQEEYAFFSKGFLNADKNIAQILGLVLEDDSTAN